MSIADDENRVEAEEENMAAWLVAVKTLRIQPYTLPPLGPHDVKIRMKAVGICGSDVHHFKNMRCANFVVRKPMVIGHECAGIIEEVGSQVNALMVGDRVALEPGISCSRCNHCKNGSYNLCPEMKFFGSPPTNGSLANMVVHPASLCFKLPDNVSLEEGAMCEPLSVGVHACRRAQISPETKVLIVGAGPIGLVTMLAARAFGAPKIIMVDIDDQRLAFAKKLGADGILQVSTSIEDMQEEIVRIHDAMGCDIDVSFDCVGFDKTMSTALAATRSGGKVCSVGLGKSEMNIPLTPAAASVLGEGRSRNVCNLTLHFVQEVVAAVRIRGLKGMVAYNNNIIPLLYRLPPMAGEVDILGIFRYRNTWPLCIEFLKTGKIDVKPLISHRFRFKQQDIEEAFDVSSRGGNAIKVMFNL